MEDDSSLKWVVGVKEQRGCGCPKTNKTRFVWGETHNLSQNMP